MSTIDNLKDAFAGESQANRKYLAFAKKADEDGFKQIAKLFRAAADAETIHAHSHLRVLGVKGTKDNLKEAIAGETYEYEKMYPKMIEEAIAEGNLGAKISFSNANAAEKVHANLYKQALDAVNNGSDLDYEEMYVCQVCGHTIIGGAPSECPVCRSKKIMFKKIN